MSNRSYTVEYYYKAKWGYAEEFLRLYKKNHHPILQRQVELGRILNITIVKPRLHATEDGRWDFRVTITWKDISATDDGFDESAIARQLYPDQELFKKEEQRRFDILLAHWDVPIADIQIDR